MSHHYNDADNRRTVERNPFIEDLYALLPPIDRETHDRVQRNAAKVAALLSGTRTDAKATSDLR